jgi:hypothetical protein
LPVILSKVTDFARHSPAMLAAFDGLTALKVAKKAAFYKPAQNL